MARTTFWLQTNGKLQYKHRYRYRNIFFLYIYLAVPENCLAVFSVVTNEPLAVKNWKAYSFLLVVTSVATSVVYKFSTVGWSALSIALLGPLFAVVYRFSAGVLPVFYLLVCFRRPSVHQFSTGCSLQFFTSFWPSQLLHKMSVNNLETTGKCIIWENWKNCQAIFRLH